MADINNPTVNATLYDENGNAVNVILDGAIWRLAVDAKITNTAPSIIYKPRRTAVTTPTAILAGATLNLVNFSGAGKGVSVVIRFENDKHELRIAFDGVDLFNGRPKDVLDVLGYSDAGKYAEDIWTDNKITSFRFTQPADFASSFLVSVKNTDTSSRELLGYRVEYRII